MGGATWPCEARLLFIRHAQAEAKGGREGVSKRDPNLSAHGYRQAELLCQRLRDTEGAAGLVVICSPMRRCLHTAAPVAAGNGALLAGGRAVCQALLCEHGNSPGDFSAADVAMAFPQLFGADTTHHVAMHGFGGKASGDTPERAAAAAAWLKRECGQQVSKAAYAVFSHQTFLDALLQILVRGSAGQWEYGSPEFRFQNTAVTELRIGPAGTRVMYRNDSSHLR